MNNTLVIAAVNTHQSINLDLAKKICYAGSYDLLDLNDYRDNCPILSTKYLVNKQFPTAVKEILLKLTNYQNIIIVTPEHNGYYSAFFKNILDWLSRLDNQFFFEKNIVLVVASPGAQGGASLRQFAKITLSYTGAKTIQDFGFGAYDPDHNVDAEIKKIIDYIDNLNP
ncbi:NAD(P)H-dependent FMN reductase [[Mycoplasma] cavipharyngis]|uniref:NAD(P)H-dependent oxidoreductase n=1 Tax=[Mycoplasma] cavipharyngis TaxID=92757 RepID=UPI003703F457